ncbi:ribbon-helix-helix domain-containing protein [Brasilonema sp. UFV-L1]|uniref:ribbon-helix-helix domain-containing protein n=1 Tax=Brasilonema sp. UFV-L1 TaxID=2234130 RepID=UPI00145FC80F|nr:ribbon-helix-helix domain-containing protein [Brasilonema sp. UFV-L1]NMG11629.1 CopG family transcriptional regulator [Brasilonema sp. UFV-L1]
MSTKKRKSLDDALASEFVYGSKEQPEPQDEQEPKPEQETVPVTKPAVEPTSTQPTKFNLMSQLQPTTPKEATVRLTVDLPESMHRKLSVLAAKTGRKKAEIVRFLLDEALKEVNE